MTYLQHRCLLCGTLGVRYAKTKGGFHKVCDDCRKILADNDLLQPEEIIHAMSEASHDRR